MILALCVCYSEKDDLSIRAIAKKKAMPCHHGFSPPPSQFAGGNSPYLDKIRTRKTERLCCSCHILQRRARLPVQIALHRYRGLHLSKVTPRAIPCIRDSTNGMMKGKRCISPHTNWRPREQEKLTTLKRRFGPVRISNATT